MHFEWDSAKAGANERKHGIGFLEASSVFGDPAELTVYDPDHSADEDRFLSIGRTSAGRIVVVA